jgi:hypothetical protein
MSNRRKLKPVQVEPYPGEARAISTGSPPPGQFGKPPPGCIDLESPHGERPPGVLLAFVLKTRCRHCGKRPGALVLTGGAWHVVTEHPASCPDSEQRRGQVSELTALVTQPGSPNLRAGPA